MKLRHPNTKQKGNKKSLVTRAETCQGHEQSREEDAGEVEGVGEVTGMALSYGTTGRANVIFSFLNVCGLDCAIFIQFFQGGIMGRRLLVLCMLKHELFV